MSKSENILGDGLWKCNYPDEGDKTKHFWDRVSKTYYRDDDKLGLCLDQMLDDTFQISQLLGGGGEYKVYEKFVTFEEAEFYFKMKYL